MRCRITFSKTKEMRFTGHLDLHSTLERTMRRANLPLAYSQGFNPRPKLSLASALPLGYTSTGEAAEFWLKEEVAIAELRAALEKAVPPGIVLHKVEETPADAPKLQNALTSARFTVTLWNQVTDLEKRLTTLMQAASIPRERVRKGKKKVYDLRQLILEAELLDAGEDGRQRLSLHLQAEPGATGRPDEVLEELGLDPLAAYIQRDKLIYKV